MLKNRVLLKKLQKTIILFVLHFLLSIYVLITSGVEVLICDTIKFKGVNKSFSDYKEEANGWGSTLGATVGRRPPRAPHSPV